VTQPATNDFGKISLGLGDSRTSVAVAFLGLGIAVGCMTAAKASHQRVNGRVCRVGAWGLVASLAGVAAIGVWAAGNVGPPVDGAEPFARLLLPSRPFELPLRVALTLLGFFAGLFVVPLQVFMQSRPPEDQKGRMIGAMNLVNWIGILLSAAFLGIAKAVMGALGVGASAASPGTLQNAHWLFGMLALFMLPVALFYRPPDVALDTPAAREG
jgi:acyl-[acyl-carrier-protein]-phospholipid O-acyltransferase/long-chain-fatty-acid--[acyl-carrier-protein] ligase